LGNCWENASGGFVKEGGWFLLTDARGACGRISNPPNARDGRSSSSRDGNRYLIAACPDGQSLELRRACGIVGATLPDGGRTVVLVRKVCSDKREREVRVLDVRGGGCLLRTRRDEVRWCSAGTAVFGNNSRLLVFHCRSLQAHEIHANVFKVQHTILRRLDSMPGCC